MSNGQKCIHTSSKFIHYTPTPTHTHIHTLLEYSHDKTQTRKQLTWMLSVAYLVREVYSHHQSSEIVWLTPPRHLSVLFFILVFPIFRFVVCRPRRIPVGKQYTWWPTRHTPGRPLGRPGSPVRFPGTCGGIIARPGPHNHKAGAVALAVRLHQSGHPKSSIAGRVKWV